ncbi:polysaccharide deacetylase family protein [Bacteroides sp. OttesenSCG-928-F21]|nr:polysaccharide deacetylase family protein [Bacteroides sp. OttesenSCG-928-F21]
MIVAVLLLLALFLFFFYASYSIERGFYLKSFCRKSTQEKVIAITFDDGPHPVQTPKVLDILHEESTPATFFCIGSLLAGNEEVVRRMVREGHGIGNHSYHHSWKFPLLTLRRMTEELTHTQQLLEEIGGREVRWFRPPFGVTNPTVAKAVKRLGYRSIGWNIRSFDTRSLHSHSEVLRRIRKGLRPGSVLLLHDRLPESDLLLREVLKLLRTEGYRVVSLQELLN